MPMTDKEKTDTDRMPDGEEMDQTPDEAAEAGQERSGREQLEEEERQEELIKTNVKRKRVKPQGFGDLSSAVRIFTDGLVASKIWFSLAVLAVIAALVEPVLIVNIMKKEERVIALDSLGTVYISPLKDFQSASELQTSQIKFATSALLDRNPDGVDNPELLKTMYLTDAYNQARQMINNDEKEFKAKQLHQKAEITGIEILGTRDNAILGRAVGQLIRTGVFNDSTFAEVVHFDLNLTLVRNPNLGMNGRFPTAVYAFRLEKKSGS
jgi:hypothetical protein